MTTEGLMIAFASYIRAYATAPLKDCEVHIEDQLAYEGTSGAVVIQHVRTTQTHICVGNTADTIRQTTRLHIEARVEWEDTQASFKDIHKLARQIMACQRLNENMSADGALTWTSSREDRTYTTTMVQDGTDKVFWQAELDLAFDYTPEEAT